MAKYNYRYKIKFDPEHPISIEGNQCGRADRTGMVWECSGRTSAFDVIG